MRSYYAYMRLCQAPIPSRRLHLWSVAMTPDHHALAPLPQSPSHWLHSYPAHLSRTWTLASGESLLVRPIRHDDGELEEAFVRALSLQSRYHRMFDGGTK